MTLRGLERLYGIGRRSFDENDFEEEVIRRMTILRPGDLVYIDSYNGLIPAKLLSVDGVRVTVQVTADRPGYKRGEKLQRSKWRVVPRTHVLKRKNQSSLVLGGYDYAAR